MRQIETSEKWTTSLMSQSPAKLCLLVHVLLHVLLVDLISLLEVRWRKLLFATLCFILRNGLECEPAKRLRV